jgi:hypothetical protein
MQTSPTATKHETLIAHDHAVQNDAYLVEAYGAKSTIWSTAVQSARIFVYSNTLVYISSEPILFSPLNNDRHLIPSQ